MDTEIKVINGLNITDSLLTMFIFTNPLFIQYELNPAISFGYYLLGKGIFFVKILLGYFLFRWYHNNYKQEKIYPYGIGVATILLLLFVVINIKTLVVA